jgi:hypothetical protein
MGSLGTGASVGAQQDPEARSLERTGGEAVGASIAHPPGWLVEREPYTYGDTYGFTLWKPVPASAEEHGAAPAVRVALAYDLRPEQIEQTVSEKIAAYPDLPLAREEVAVGEEGHAGVAVGPIPGSTPSTEVYVPVNGDVRPKWTTPRAFGSALGLPSPAPTRHFGWRFDKSITAPAEIGVTVPPDNRHG